MLALLAGQKHATLRACCATTAIGLALLCVVPGIMAQDVTPAMRAESRPARSHAESTVLREHYYNPPSRSRAAHDIVGRVGLVLVDSNGSRVVAQNQIFRNGDRVRFAISSNHDGWLHVFYIKETRAEQVWPRSQSAKQAYPLCAGKEYLVPPVPAVFRFGNNPGTERFFVSISRNPSPPEFDGTQLRWKQNQGDSPDEIDICAESGKRKIINFDVRDPLIGRDGGMSYDPGTEGLDPYSYFAAPAEQPRQGAVFELQLRHVR